ncbi:MAG: DMT family transporter [Firmicutes bacterium]|nr:DMT family transporter [Bacillota bacterium]
MSKKALGNILLVLTAMIWGLAFVAQKKGAEMLEPFTLNGIRFFIAAAVLIPVIIISIKLERKAIAKRGNSKISPATENEIIALEAFTEEHPAGKKEDIVKGGLLCGIVLFCASSVQQIGIGYTTAGKSGFITAFYIVLVPVLGIIIGKKIRPILWLCVVMALFGLYLICIKEGFSVNKGDLLVFVCSFCYAVHILVIDHFSPRVNGILLSCIQFTVVGVLSIPFMAIFETVDIDKILECWLPICYAGVMAGGVGFTLQIVAQKYTEPTVASLLMSLESVFAVLGGWLILSEVLSAKEAIGCVLMFIAIILSQLPPGKKQVDLNR